MTQLTISGYRIDDQTTFEYKSNPKRVNCAAWKRYENYQEATNIEEYLELTKENSKFAKADLRYDVEHGHLKLIDEDGNWLNEPTETTEAES